MTGQQEPLPWNLLVEGVLSGRAEDSQSTGGRASKQCTNYLKATGLRLCLLLNFGKPRLEIRRVVHGL
jgi:GxxExxY protein